MKKFEVTCSAHPVISDQKTLSCVLRRKGRNESFLAELLLGCTEYYRFSLKIRVKGHTIGFANYSLRHFLPTNGEATKTEKLLNSLSTANHVKTFFSILQH